MPIGEAEGRCSRARGVLENEPLRSKLRAESGVLWASDSVVQRAMGLGDCFEPFACCLKG
jgi:hypothetical protein